MAARGERAVLSCVDPPPQQGADDVRRHHHDARHAGRESFRVSTAAGSVDQDPYQTAVTAWMRVHLMGDTGLRGMFYGTTCQLCTNTQVKVQRKNMNQQ